MWYPVKRQTTTQPELDAGKEPNVESLIYGSDMKLSEEMIKSIYSSTAGSIYNKPPDEQSPQNIVVEKSLLSALEFCIKAEERPLVNSTSAIDMKTLIIATVP